jgi:ribonuclease D
MSPSPEERIVTTRDQLRELVQHVRAQGRFAFDTEFVSEDTFEPVLCLLQVATDRRLAVIDPQAVGDVTMLWELVLDPAIDLVMHAAGEDLRICQIRNGALPSRVFDVQIAAGLVGYSYPLSLVNLVSQALHVSLQSSETRTDWRRRPLSPAQLRYALDDVRYLLPLADLLRAELKKRGREPWADEEFNAFLNAVGSRADEERWRRLPGLHQLNRRGLEAARRLSEWREEEARRQNRPIRQILRDDLLVAIARRQPSGRRDLEALRDFNRPGLLNKSQAILELVARARGVPEHELPDPYQRPDDSPGASTVASLLSVAMAQSCIQNEVANSLVANVSDLKHLIRWYLDGRTGDRRPRVLEGWRGPVCGELLLAVLEGRRTFRVANPASEFPIAMEPARPGGDEQRA